MVRSSFKGIIVPILVVNLLACTNQNSSKGGLKVFQDPSNWGLFSDRDTSNENFIGMVTLQTPPLLEFLKNENNVLSIDPEAIAAVEKEQASFEEQLKKETPNVQIFYKYKLALNGYALHGPLSEVQKLKKLGMIKDVEVETKFEQPKTVGQSPNIIRPKNQLGSPNDWGKANSVKFIGAEAFHSIGFKGQSIKVGIIDTGVDYTHSMLGGSGNPEDYKQIERDKVSSFFPNKKVVGGIDLTGDTFAPGAKNFSDRIPVIDSNPLDVQGHGTHVAATVAGVGDGAETYSGVAPEADLYAIKVFGAGGTTDYVVTAALEYALDPNQDLNLSDRLDVVNLSLGGAFGGPQILYSEVLERVVNKANMIVVAAAGNSGPIDYIIGAPATADHALSVAASIDNSLHNWVAQGIQVTQADGTKKVLQAPLAQFGPSYSEFGQVSGELVDVGMATAQLNEELAAQVKGKVALIKRGENPFAQKVTFAQNAGAIAAVIYNDREGEPFAMPGDTKTTIPAVFIDQVAGDELSAEVKLGAVTVTFSDNFQLQKPNVIDRITEFSSKGPRSDDLRIKPEIAAPGENVQSAAVGTGNKGIKFSGTSMAAPHIAGVMAVAKQAFPLLTPIELKGMVMNSAIAIKQKDNEDLELVTLQGAGRVRMDMILTNKALIKPAALSFGLLQIDRKKRMRKQIEIKNLNAEPLKLSISVETRHSTAVSLASSAIEQVAAQSSKSVFIDLDVLGSALEDGQELDGFVVFKGDNKLEMRVPFLMIVKKTSAIQVTGDLEVFSDATVARGAASTITLKNNSSQDGAVFFFNLLGADARKADSSTSKFKSKNCDIQSVGYRIMDGKDGERMQLAVKLYNPVTHWSRCEITALIDANGDQSVDQELAYVTAFNIPGLSRALGGNSFATLSVLFNTDRIRQVMGEADLMELLLGERVISYIPAIDDVQSGLGLPHSTIVILEAETSKLLRKETGELMVKVASQDYSGMPVEADDFFKPEGQDWMKLSLESDQQGFQQMPMGTLLAGGTAKTIELKKGAGAHSLMLVMPSNEMSFSQVNDDKQQIVVTPKFW